jgi:hypothetical protein
MKKQTKKNKKLKANTVIFGTLVQYAEDFLLHLKGQSILS